MHTRARILPPTVYPGGEAGLFARYSPRLEDNNTTYYGHDSRPSRAYTRQRGSGHRPSARDFDAARSPVVVAVRPVPRETLHGPPPTGRALLAVFVGPAVNVSRGIPRPVQSACLIEATVSETRCDDSLRGVVTVLHREKTREFRTRRRVSRAKHGSPSS